MKKCIVNSYDELAAHLGKQLGESDWLTVDQQRINKFADATLDHQWIHTDIEKAKAESPYKSTIAHGYLTLSLLPYLWNESVEVHNIHMMVNYGMESIDNLRGVCKAGIKFRIEIEGAKKPALEGIATFLYYFD